MRTRLAAFLSLGLVGAMASFAGCSLLNAPDDIREATGAGGAGGSGGGAPIPCTMDDECTALSTDCAEGKCAMGTCQAAPKPADTPCGATPASTCDLADVCDAAGNCVNATAPDGSFCDDCPAGSGKCARCVAGACGDCAGRATEKSFRTPASADGWTLAGSWAIRAATPPQPPDGQQQCSDGSDNDGDTLIDLADPDCTGTLDPHEYTPQCSDGFDDDGDGFIDFPADPGCTSASDEYEVVEGEITFDHPVLGTDGNRAHAYTAPNVQFEGSFALSPPAVIPSELRFKSWNLDEGSYYDKKAVQITTDGTNFDTIAVCEVCSPNAGFCSTGSDCCSGSCVANACQPAAGCVGDGSTCVANAGCCNASCVGGVCAPPPAFCQFHAERAADDWDDIVLNVPASLVGKVGQVQFKYDTRDECCNFERGWYIDALSFATECACAGAADCGYVDGTCGTGTCDSGTSECRLTAKSTGNACAGAGTSDCSSPTCDANGFCNDNALVLEGSTCSMCADPDGQCDVCMDGACADCWPVQTFSANDNVSDQFDASDWTFTGDWALTTQVVRNSVSATDEYFPNGFNEKRNDPHMGPMLGNNGSRVPGGITSETETGTATTSLTVIPATLTFNSWNQDRGGNDSFSLRDKKQILVSLDDGMTWQVLFDCSGKSLAFCQPWPTPATNRALDAWDAISIPVDAAYAGQVGRLRFVYDTVDSGGGWERGWYIDDLNVSRCD
jgi:hypothetical protein